jgi:hypothetical protein
MSIDEQIASAGLRLASTPVAVPELARLVRRRSRRVRAIAVVGSVVVISIGVAGLIRHERSSVPAAKSGVPTDNRAGDASTRRYELTLEGARLVDGSTRSARNGPTAVWLGQATGVYVTLAVLPGEATTTPGPSGLGSMVEDARFPSSEGRAWFTAISDSDIRQTKMWWERSDGDVWLLNGFWYGDNPVGSTEGRDILRKWALGITAPDPQRNQHYELVDPPMSRIAEDGGGDVESRFQVWSYQVGSVVEHITLVSDDDSVASGVVAILARDKPEVVRIDGHDAWQVTDSSTGDTYIGWQTGGDRPAWTGLIIPAPLASLTPEIRAALRSE